MKTNKDNQPAPVKEEATAKKAPAEAVAYVGPDIKNVAINGTVYAGELPEALSEKITEIPAIKGLLIPVSNYAKAGVEIANGGALKTLYDSVNKAINK